MPVTDRVPEVWSDSAAVDAAVTLLGPRARRNAPLGAVTTSRVGGRAAVAFTANTATDLLHVRDVSAASGLEVLVVGRGSNLLIADAGFEGIALFLGTAFSRIDIEPRDATVTAGAAVALPVLARRSASAGVAGLEWAVGVPGSVGGAVRMNAGGHGSDVAACLIDASLLDMAPDAPREPTTVDVGSLGLEYRSSGLKDSDVVVRARFQGHSDEPDASMERIAEIVRWRREHQPGGQNAGSVFMNPPNDSAGARIDRAGLRGLRIGSAEVSRIHANFIVSDPGGTASDVAALIAEVRGRITRHAGVDLRPEIRFVGFDAPSADDLR